MPPSAQDNLPSPPPREVAKQDLARRLAHAMKERDLNQAELGRLAGVPRGLVSNYVRGESWPAPKNIRRMAIALGMKEEDLVPSQRGMAAIEEAAPSFAVTEMIGHHGKMWLRVNRMVSARTAMAIGQLIQDDAEK